MISKIKKAIVKLKAPRSPIKREVFYLKRAIEKTDEYIDDIFAGPMPACCHFCAYPDLHPLLEKQTRRRSRLKQLEAKLEQNR